MLVHNINTKFGNGAYTPVQLITRDNMAASPATWLDPDPNWSRIRIIVDPDPYSEYESGSTPVKIG